MADNVTLPGTGENVSAEEVTTLNAGSVSAVKVQRVGLGLITANSTAVDLPGDSTNGLTVNLGTNNDVTVTGTVTANAGTNLNTSTLALESGGNLAAAVTALQALDNIVAGNEAQVDVITLPDGSVAAATVKTADFDSGAGTDTVPMFGVALPASGGAVAGGTSTNPIRTDPTGSTTQPVSGTVALGAGSASVGTLGANSGVDIGDVTINNASGASAVNIQDGGNSITVDGTVAATQSGSWTVTGAGGTFPVTDSGGSLTVDAPVGTPAFVRLSDGSAAITTLPVSLASVPSHAVTNAGTFATQVDGAALTALQLIDNLPNTLGSTTSGQSGALVLGAVTTSAPTYTTGQSNAVSLQTDGSLRVAVTNGGSGGTAMADDANFVPGTTSVTPVAGTYRTSRDTLNDNDAGAIAITERRAVLTAIETPAGDSAMDDTNDAVRVNIVAGAAAGGTSMTDGATFTPGSSALTPIGGTFDDVTPATVTEGDAAACRITENRALHVNLRAADGSELAVGGATQYAVDTAANGAEELTMAGFVRVDAPSTLTPADGDRVNARVDALGRQWVNGSGVTQPVSDASGSLTVDAPVGTPVFVRLSDGSAAITTLPVSLASVPSHAVTNGGTFVVQENGAALTALQLIDNLPNTIGSTTSGQSGALSMGAVTTGAPTYTTAQTNPLSLQTDGSLRAAITNTVTVASHAVTNAGTFATQVDGAALTALQLIDNLPNTLGSTTSGQSGALVLGAVTTAAPTYTTAQSNAISLQTDGSVRAAITNTVTVGSHAVTNAGTFAVQPTAGTSGGWTPGKLISAATTNATSVKASAGQVGYLQVTNINAAVRYLKIYNKASAPTVGTDTPVQTFGIPGNTAGAGFTLSFGPGMELTTGFAFALTTGAADSDTGGVGAGDIIVNYGYR